MKKIRVRFYALDKETKLRTRLAEESEMNSLFDIQLRATALNWAYVIV